MTRYTREELEILEEVQSEAAHSHLLATVCTYVSFVSKSNGHGRKPRRHWREVELLIYRGRAYQLSTRMTRDIEWIMKSIFPEEMIPPKFGNDWYGAFVQALRTMPKVKKGKTKSGTKYTLRRKKSR